MLDFLAGLILKLLKFTVVVILLLIVVTAIAIWIWGV